MKILDAIKKPFGNANYKGWICPYCGARNWEEKPGIYICAQCDTKYKVYGVIR